MGDETGRAAGCLKHAPAADERYGIWGATLPEERRSMQASAAKTGTAPRRLMPVNRLVSAATSY
jgi:hypothetical protein